MDEIKQFIENLDVENLKLLGSIIEKQIEINRLKERLAILEKN